MREIDLLPAWYVDMHRRKNQLRIQTGVAAAVVVLMVGWTVVNAQLISSSNSILEQKQIDLVASEQRVQQRTVQQQLRDQLRTQDRVESSLGLDVESSRVLDLVGRALPASASLLDMSMETREQQRPLLQQGFARGSTLAPVPDRRLQVTLKCVAPANIDVATVLENLTNSRVCEDLRLDYSKEKVVDNAVMREFQIGFQVNLNCDTATASGAGQ